MYILISLVAFVILITVLVGVHEVGHFATARFFGIRVEEFGFGFPPRLWGKRRGETLYSINAIPLGGFVRMTGENSDSDDPRSFGAKPAWQRAVVLCAGAFMNLIAAFVLFFMVFTITPVPKDVPRVDMVVPGSPAAHALQAGDVVTSVDGVPVDTGMAMRDAIYAHRGHPTLLVVQRHGQTLHLTVVPRVNPPAGQGWLGVRIGGGTTSTDPLSALQQTLEQPGAFFGAVGNTINPPPHSAGGGFSGPVGVARATGDAANAVPTFGLGPVIYLAAVVSLNLAVVNMLPIPALDGGRLLFVLIGLARRRQVNPQLEGLIHLAGMAVLLSFVVLVTGHDIQQWISGGQ